MSLPIVQVQSVGKHYGQNAEKVLALKGVSITIADGSFSSIIGASGCGKTTLLNLVGCLDRPDGGHISVCGTDVLRLDDEQLTKFRRQKIGFVFQNFNLIPVLTSFENVEYALIALSMPKDERRERVHKVLEGVGLANKANAYPNELSGGQKQRVAIARALVKEPAIVLADEPTANLDSATAKEIVSLMRKMQEEKSTTFILATHDRALIESSDQSYLMRDGAISGM